MSYRPLWTPRRLTKGHPLYICMSASLFTVLGLVDDIKEKLKDQEYKDIVDELARINTTPVTDELAGMWIRSQQQLVIMTAERDRLMSMILINDKKRSSVTLELSADSVDDLDALAAAFVSRTGA